MMSIFYDLIFKKESPVISENADEKELCFKYFDQWSKDDQVSFVEILLSRMSDDQQAQIHDYLSPLMKRDFISLLSKKGLVDVAEKILLSLDAGSLHSAEQVCKDWLRIIEGNLLWKILIEREVSLNSALSNLFQRRGWTKYLLRGESCVSSNIRFSYNMYVLMHKILKKVKQNWKDGIFTVQKINCQSERKGVYCLQYDDNKIVCGLRDNNIKIWDKNTLMCTNTLSGHCGSILCIQYDNKIIISGSSDNSVKIWSVSTGELLNTLLHHGEAVLNLRFIKGILVTCSKDRSVAIWNIISPTEIHLVCECIGHKAAVNAVDLDETYIVSASGDKTIKLWSTSTGEFLRTFSGHTRGVACLQKEKNLIVSGSSDTTIRVWNIHGICLKILSGHLSLVRCLKFNDNWIVSGDYNGKIKVWDLKALKTGGLSSQLCIQTLEQHTGRVFRLEFDHFQIVSSSHDDAILIWDFLKTPEDDDIDQLSDYFAKASILHQGD